MSRPLNVKVGDIFANYKVISEPFVPEGKKYSFCLCKCIMCGKEKLVRSFDLKNLKYGCTCTKPIPQSIKKPTKVKNMSFQEWCIINNKQSILDRWDHDLNKYTPDQISFKSNYKIYFKCPNGKHKSKHVALSSISNGGNQLRCDECYLEESSFGVWCQKNKPHILALWDYELNGVSPYDISYGTTKEYYFKCPRGLHDSQLKTISKITNRGDDIRCDKCNSVGQFIIDHYGQNGLDMIWDYEKNIYDPFEIARCSRKYIYIKCINNSGHPSYRLLCSNFAKGRGCPECKREREESKLQEKVRTYIEEKYGYDILHEYACTLRAISPKTKYILPYDNQVVIGNIENLIIEVHGVQHYNIKNSYIKLCAQRHGLTIEQEFAETQWRDEYKRQYALSQGYYYLAIPYWTEQDESYKTLIDQKIQEILTIQN